jgi:hypothetical protein
MLPLRLPGTDPRPRGAGGFGLALAMKKGILMKDFMTKLSYRVNRLTNILMKVSLWIGIALCITMTVATIGQVFCRHTGLFVFESSEEIARFSMCWLAMLGSAVALHHARQGIIGGLNLVCVFWLHK